MTDFSSAPQPKTELGRYRILSPNAGVRVSPFALGAMSIGSAWSGSMGAMNKEQSFKLLDAFVDAGGNFIDTACNYQNEESERWIGEWMEERHNRDFMVIATKFTTDYRSWEIGKGKSVNFQGNHRKNIHLCVRDSLEKLRTDYIDLLYLHWWDWSTSIEEVMESLHILVEQGKVLYLGISDSPAWVVAAANTYAKQAHKTPFSVYQGQWNVMKRDLEYEIVPMARHFGMAICPWDVAGGGRFKTKKMIEEKKRAGEGVRSIFGVEQTEDEAKMSEALEKIAQEHGGASITAVAIAYVMQKTRYVCPIIGGRKVEHLMDNIKALSIHLTDQQIEYLESVVPSHVPFPFVHIGDDPHETGKSMLVESTAQIAWQQNGKPIGHE